MALVSLPQHRPIQIFTDSQGLISGFQSFVAQAHLQSFRALLRTRFYQEWAVLQQIVSHCTAPVIFNKVEAHTGNFGNELADHIAKQGAVRGVLWKPSFSCVPGIQFLPVHSDCSLVEGDLQAYLKLQSQFRTSVAWQYHRHVQCNVPYFDSVD